MQSGADPESDPPGTVSVCPVPSGLGSRVTLEPWVLLVSPCWKDPWLTGTQ